MTGGLPDAGSFLAVILSKNFLMELPPRGYVPVMFLFPFSQVNRILTGVEVIVPLFLEGLCAGFPSPADDYIDQQIDLTRLLVPNPPATFLWRVDGHSMKDAGIFHGDILVVDRSLTAVHGSIVVAIVNGERSLKRLLLDPRPRLVFENHEFPAYPLEEAAEVEIWGVVRCNIHWLHGGKRE
jgi:DNA polymerase V